MTRFLLIVALTLFTGCKTNSYCHTELKEDGWIPTASVPQQLLQHASFDRFWYTNGKGDYLLCPKRLSEYVCGGGFVHYVRTPEGYSNGDFIACIT